MGSRAMATMGSRPIRLQGLAGLLLLAVLAVALHGVQSDELDVPIEDLCQPLIEKALKELGEHGESHEVPGDDQANPQQEKGESKEEEPDDTVKDDNESHSRRKRETAPSEEVSDNKSGERSGESSGKSAEDKMETVEIITIEDESIEGDSIQSIENQESAEVGAAERTSREKKDSNEEVINASVESTERTPVARGDGDVSRESLEKESGKVRVTPSITPPRKERKEFDEKGRRLRYGKFTKVEELDSEERITPVGKESRKREDASVGTSGMPASGEKKGRMRYGKWTKSSELTSEEKYTSVGKTVATTGSKADKDEPRLRYGKWTVTDQLDSSERHVPVSEIGKQKSTEPTKKIEKKKVDFDYKEVDRKKLRYGKWTKLEELEESEEKEPEVETSEEVSKSPEVKKPTFDEPPPNVQISGVDDTGRRLRYGRWTKLQELDSSERYIPVSEVTKKPVQEKRDRIEKKSGEKIATTESLTKIDMSGKDETGRRLRFGRWTKVEDLDSSERYIPISEVQKRPPSEKRETIDRRHLEKLDKESVSTESLKIDPSGKDETGRRLRFGRWTKVEELDSSERYIPISEVDPSKKTTQKASTKELSHEKRIGRYGKWTKFEELESEELEDKSKEEEVKETVERKKADPVSRSNVQISGIDDTGRRLRYGRWTKIEELDSDELYTPISQVQAVKSGKSPDHAHGEKSKHRLKYGKWTKVEDLKDEDETSEEPPIQTKEKPKVETHTGYDEHGKRLKYGKWTKVEELENEREEKVSKPEIRKEHKVEPSTPTSTLDVDLAGKDETGKRLRYGRWTKIESLDSEERYIPISEVTQKEPRKSVEKISDKKGETGHLRYGKWTLVDQLDNEERTTPVGHTPAKESESKEKDRPKLKYGKWTKLEELEPPEKDEEKVESSEVAPEAEIDEQYSREGESLEESTGEQEESIEDVTDEAIESVEETIADSIEESETISEEPLDRESVEIEIDDKESDQQESVEEMYIKESDQQESVEEIYVKEEVTPEAVSIEKEQEISSESVEVEKEKSEEKVSTETEKIESSEKSEEEIIEKPTPVIVSVPEIPKAVKIEAIKKIEKKIEVQVKPPKKEVIEDTIKRSFKEPTRKVVKLPDSDESAVPEEELTMEIEYPEELRPRDHINELLKLDEENEETERAVEKVAGVILKDLKKLYETAIKPLETVYKYRDLSNRHFGDSEIFSKPLVLFMGPWSGGKSSIINYLLDIEYKHTSLRTGAEPSPAYFNILMYGEKEEILDGTQLAADWTFSGLQKFGQGMLDRLKGYRMKNKLLEKINIVEIPGILEIRKQVQRLFPFNDACQWFIDRADIIFLVYDPSKLDVGPETEAILDQLKGREYQTRIILNKADQVRPEELMRVQGALIWNISPLMSSAEPPIMYSTSLWSVPYESGAPTRLLYAQERAFLRDLRSAIEKRVDHKIASARRFAVRVRNHAKMVDCYLTTFYNHKSFFSKKQDVSDKIIDNPQDYHIYEGLSTLTNISRYDLPDPDVYRDFFHLNPLYDFPLLSSTCTYFRGCPINRLDVAIAYDLPELVGRYKKLVEAAIHDDYEEELTPPKPKPRRTPKSSLSKKNRS